MFPSVLLYGGALGALLGLLGLLRARLRRRALVVLLAGIGLSALGLLLPVRDATAARAETRLDAHVPRWIGRERHVVAIAAPPMRVDSAIRLVAAEEIRFYRALTWIRRFGRDGPPSLIDAPRGEPILALATRTGFQLLADEPGREIVFGVAGPVSREARVAVRRDGPRAFGPPADGYASIAMNFLVTPDGRGGSVLSTETRLHAPDPRTRRRLATYWRVIYPGSALIRRGWLAAIRRRAETGRAQR